MDQDIRDTFHLGHVDGDDRRYFSANVSEASYRGLVASLKTLGFSESECNSLFSVVAAVLLLGNLEFEVVDANQLFVDVSKEAVTP